MSDFQTFPGAFKSAFQIFMQESWTEVMEDLLLFSGPDLAVFVYLFVLIFHLLAATILVSIFVALILDNLELEEEEKLIKQIRQGKTETKVELPINMRVYEWLR